MLDCRIAQLGLELRLEGTSSVDEHLFEHRPHLGQDGVFLGGLR
jgi:hypothetical protein